MSKSKLVAVEPKEAKQKKPKILIYGKPGVGKTFTSLDFPRCYYIDTEDGANMNHYTDKLRDSGGVYMGTEQGSLDFEVILEQVKALGTEKHPYKTLILDSVSKLFNVEYANEQERLGDKDQFGASKKKPIQYMRRLVNWLNRIDMNVILISHEKSEWGLNSNKERVEIGTTFDCWDKLEYELDLVLNIVKAGPARIARVRKSRLLEFPETETFDWSYPEFAERYGQDVIEQDVKSIELASPEQLQQIKDLIERVNLPDGQETKWLKAAKVDGWDEMTSDRVQNAINHIKETYLKN